MPLISTPAIVLSTLRYGETSKIVRLATREHGIQSAIAKGALRKRSPFGAALQVLSEGTAHYLAKEQRELHILTGFEISHLRVGLAGDMERYSAASVLSEVMLRLAPAAPHPETYDALAQGLDVLEAVPAAATESYALRSIWHLVSALGFAPSLDACAQDGRALAADGPVHLSVAEGGALCDTCARSRPSIELPARSRRDLADLLSVDRDLPLLDARHAAAHRRLLGRWIRTHAGEESELPAMDFWQRRPWVAA